MSVIGPRPLLVEYLPYYTKEEHHRHDVRPGLSGWAQINGRNAIDSWEQRFQYDLAIAVTSSKVSKMDFLIIDTEILNNHNLEFKQTYAGRDAIADEYIGVRLYLYKRKAEKLRKQR